jgi:transposase
MTTPTDQRTSPARSKKAGEAAELERLRKKVARLEKDLAKRDAALQVMGKASALLA